MTDFDLLVVGGGPGGYVCAIRAAQLGLKTALAEKDRVGGECLNYACIPSKTLINVSKIYDKVRHGDLFGIKNQGLEIDFKALQKWRQNVVNTLVSGVEQLLKGNGVTILKGEAEVLDRHNANVSGQNLTFKKLVIATGSAPSELPNVKYDGRFVIGSREVLQLDLLPEKLLIIGGGVVGMEVACLYSRLGSKVTVVEVMDQILPGYDSDVVRLLHRVCERKGIKVYLRSTVLSIEKGEDEAYATLKTGEGEVKVEANKVLLSVGRRPRIDGIPVERLGIKTDKKGFIITDQRMMTSLQDVFAIGDVRGPPLLAHKASKEGIVAAEVAAGLKSEAMWKTVPDAIFTDPEIASAGFTEAAAKSLGLKAKSVRFPFAAVGRAVTAGETEGFIKLVFDEESKRMLGMQIIGPEASDIISEATLAIEMGASIEDIALIIHPHPTYPEGLMEAAEAAAGYPIHQLRFGGK